MGVGAGYPPLGTELHELTDLGPLNVANVLAPLKGANPLVRPLLGCRQFLGKIREMPSGYPRVPLGHNFVTR